MSDVGMGTDSVLSAIGNILINLILSQCQISVGEKKIPARFSAPNQGFSHLSEVAALTCDY